jgi:hypothetical protein
MFSTTAFYQAMAEKAAAQVPTIPQGPEATKLCLFEAAGLHSVTLSIISLPGSEAQSPCSCCHFS